MLIPLQATSMTILRDANRVPNELSTFLLFVSEAVSDVSHCMDKSLFERLVNFRPKLSNIDIHNIGQSFETMIPYMLNNHGPRKNATRVDRQIFQQCILFGRKSD